MRQFKPGQLQTGSLYNISASYALTASYSANVPLTASYALNALSASYALTSSYINPLQQQILVSGSLKLDPTLDPDPTGLDLDSTVLFQSASNTTLGYDLYVRQNGNLVKWKWIEGSLETGLLYGGVVTYSGSNVFISPGSGIISNHNATTGSEASPIIEYVAWNAITQSITNIATQQVTYLYIDNNGALQQQSTRFTSQQYHDYIPLGAVGHFDYTQVSAFGGSVQTSYDQISQILNFVDAFGPIKISGYGLTGQAGSLRLSVGAGTSFIHGGFYENDPEFPSQITTPSQATASLARVQRSGSVVEFDTNAGNLYTVVDPTKYDRDGDGILHNVGSGNWSIQRVFTDPKTGVLYVYYGQARYTSLLNALQYLPTDPFTEGDTFDFTTFVGYLVLKGNATNIADTANNSIINGGLFRGSGQGSGGGIALSNLDDLTDVSITTPTNGQALVYDNAIWKNGNPLSASYASTASYLNTLNQDLTFNGNLNINGTASIAVLNVTYESASIIYSSGSNQFGDAANDTQTLWGTVDVKSGPLLVTGSVRATGGFTGSFSGSVAAPGSTTQVVFNSGSVLAANSGFVYSGSNVGIGTTTPGVRLDVVGSMRSSDSVFTSELYAVSLRINSTNQFIFRNTGSVELARFDNAGNWGFGTTTPLARLDLRGTQIATGSIARTMLISSSLSASANNDTLVGLDIQPTFDTGAFTGVQSVSLRLPNGGRITNASTVGGYNVYIANNEATLNSPVSTGTVGFQLNYGFVGRFMGTTGNLLLQNGGTFTDNRYRLQVNSSTTDSGSLFISGSSSQPLLVVTSSAATALFVSGSGNIGIGTNTPGQTLSVIGNAQFGFSSISAGARLHTRGAGVSSTSTSFRAENFNGFPALRITDDLAARFDGVVGIQRAATASLDVAGTTRISGSFNTAASGSILTIIGSGSAQPIFTVQGSQGELFSITDSLSGSLFSVNDISGLPILEVFSDNTTLIGNYQDPMLITTAKVVQTNSGSFTVYSLPTASYDTAFFEYSIRSGSNARAGTIMAMQLGSAVNFTETTTTDFGDTSVVSFTVIVTGSNMALTGSSTTGSWTTKCIVRGI